MNKIHKKGDPISGRKGWVASPDPCVPPRSGVTAVLCSPLPRASPTTGTTRFNPPTFPHLLPSAQIICGKCTTKAWVFPRIWSTCSHNSSDNLCWPCHLALTSKGEVNSLRKRRELWGLCHTSIKIMLTSAAPWLFNLNRVFLWELPLSHFFALFLLYNSFLGILTWLPWLLKSSNGNPQPPAAL